MTDFFNRYRASYESMIQKEDYIFNNKKNSIEFLPKSLVDNSDNKVIIRHKELFVFQILTKGKVTKFQSIILPSRNESQDLIKRELKSLLDNMTGIRKKVTEKYNVHFLEPLNFDINNKSEEYINNTIKGQFEIIKKIVNEVEATLLKN